MFQQAILMLHTMKWKIINVILQIFIFDAAARGKLGGVGVTLGLREKNTHFLFEPIIDSINLSLLLIKVEPPYSH